MTTTAQLTKTPTTYDQVRAGDQIDNIVIIATELAIDENGQPIACLQFADTLEWGPWTPAATPVSVYR
jgi:hypothetical protein